MGEGRRGEEGGKGGRGNQLKGAVLPQTAACKSKGLCSRGLSVPIVPRGVLSKGASTFEVRLWLPAVSAASFEVSKQLSDQLRTQVLLVRFRCFPGPLCQIKNCSPTCREVKAWRK